MKLYKAIGNLLQVFPKHKQVILNSFQDLISRIQIQHNLWKRVTTFTIPFLLIYISSCTKFVELNHPNTLISGNAVYTNDASATSAVLGIYINMSTNATGFATGTQSVSMVSGLSADEFQDYSNNGDYIEFQNNKLSSVNNIILSMWGNIYKNIQNANAVIEGIEQSETLSEITRKQLMGEAKFLRAFQHFYLVNIFGDIPLVLSTNYSVNSKIKKTAIKEIYQQIINDLKEAKENLSTNYLGPDNITSTIERVRVNKSAASALLARVYLYTGDFINAELEAAEVITNVSKYKLEPDLKKVFLKNSSETIWQLMSVVPSYNTYDGLTFILTTLPSYVALNSKLYSSFDLIDKRRRDWISSFVDGTTTYYYPFKYKVKTGMVVTEYLMVLRLAEQYLIRAESRARQNKLVGAIADVDSIRNRAGLPLVGITTPNISIDGLLLVIENERRHELFTEWGHRWFDLKRTERADAVLGAVKPGWKPTAVLYPIPQNEILKNANLKPQNPGYN